MSAATLDYDVLAFQPKVDAAVSTRTQGETSMRFEYTPEFRPCNLPRSSVMESWVRAVDAKLREWFRDPDSATDEDTDPPSLRAISVANEFSQSLRRESVPPPTWVVSTGDGGISFEWKRGPGYALLKIKPDGKVLYTLVFGDNVQQVELR
jgi:hypothetical protein